VEKRRGNTRRVKIAARQYLFAEKRAIRRKPGGIERASELLDAVHQTRRRMAETFGDHDEATIAYRLKPPPPRAPLKLSLLSLYLPRIIVGNKQILGLQADDLFEIDGRPGQRGVDHGTRAGAA